MQKRSRKSPELFGLLRVRSSATPKLKVREGRKLEGGGTSATFDRAAAPGGVESKTTGALRSTCAGSTPAAASAAVDAPSWSRSVLPDGNEALEASSATCSSKLVSAAQTRPAQSVQCGCQRP